MNTGIWIGDETFRSLSRQTQEELIASLCGTNSAKGSIDQPIETVDNQEDGPPELSVHLVRRLAANTRDTTKICLRLIAEKNGRFLLSEVRDALGYQDYGKIPGIWATLNRRTRDMLSDREVSLVWWDNNEKREGINVDYEGYVSQITCKSLRKYFKID